MKKIKSKIFKILLVTTFVLPTIFTQNACSKKKDVEKYENEINKLKEEIKILEKFKSDLSHEFEPFKNLMHKYGVNNYNDLMKELTCLNDPNLQEQVLSLADCLLKTKTITFLKLQEKINDEQGGNENVEILKALVIPFNLKSINDLKGHFTINKEIITFAEKISKATDSDFIKHLEHEIDKLKIDIKHNNQELIPFYLEHLGDDSYTNGEGFIKQFDDLEGKEKNKAIIEKLAFALNCSFDEVNKEKIEQLDKDIKNNAKELLVKKKEKWDEGKNKLEQFEQDRKELIPFYLSQLWDKSYTGGENFIKQFDDLEGKEKNKTIIGRLAEVLGCNFDEVTKEKISQLEGKVREVLELIKNQGQLIDKLKKLEKCKKEAILFYFDQLWDENYTDWNSFITQFDNLEGKEKNKAIIENLAFALDCSFDEVNQQKIEQLNKDIKDKAQELLNKRKEAGDNGKDKLNEKELEFEQAKKEAILFYFDQLWDENYTDWDSFITQFDNLEGKEKNKAIIENLALALGCSFNEVNQQKIEQLNKDIKHKAQELLNKRKKVGNNGKDKIKERSLKWYEINQYKDGPIAICLGQLGGKNYIGWDNFITQFDNVEGKEKNKEIIDILSNLLDCPNELIDSKRINNLDQKVKIIAQEILIEKCEVAKEQIEQKEKRFVSCKNNLIGFCFEQLGDENYTSGENFIKQFDDSEGKEKNKKIIEKLAKILGCDYSAINHQKIANLDQITVDMVKKLFDEKRANKLKKKGEKNEKQFEQSKKELIAIYLAQLGDGGDYSYYSFFDYINMFVKRFDDQEGKRKNELIITKLASVLNCSNEEINSKKIDDLGDSEICTIMRNKLKELADEKKKTWNEGKEKKENEFALKEKQLERNREEIISFYIAKLGGSIYASGGTPDMINHDNWMEFITQFDDPEGKEKNKEIIRILAFALDCSFDEVNKGRIKKLSDEIKNNAKKILDEMKEIERKLQNEFKFDKNELIAFYLYQLGKENYIGWDNFIKQFDDFNWKNKNKAIIENLAFALNCSFDEINQQKIKQLGKDIKDKVQELLNKRIAMENENEFALKEKQLELNKKRIISFYIAMLGEGSYSTSFRGLCGIGRGKDNGSEFVTQFDNLEGKEKNKAIIENLAFALNCSFDEINKQKIKQLGKDIKDEVQELLNKGKEAGDNGKSKLNEKETKFEQAKKEAILFYLNQLWDESYKDWDNFIAQFDDPEGKEKNKAIIENLAFALNCSFDEINKQKIKQLDKDIKDKVQELLNKRIAMENENEFALKEKQLEQNKKRIISFYIAMLGDDIYLDDVYNIQNYFDGGLYLHYDNGSEFVTQFDNLEGKEKNKAIIENLAFALNCNFDEVNKQKIKKLDKDIKDEVKKMLDDKKKTWDEGKEKKENEFALKEKQLEQNRKEIISFYIAKLGGSVYASGGTPDMINHDNWMEFIIKFDDSEGKEKNRIIIEKLAFALGCSFAEVNKGKIEKLSDEIKNNAKKILDKMKEIERKLQNEFKSDKNELIAFYLYLLGKENYTNWDEFIKQFDNLEGKKKNKEIIIEIALILGCSFDEINKQKIKQLDKNIKDEVKKMLDEKKKIFDVGKDKLNEKETKFEQAKKEAIPFYLNQLWDESYKDWNNFIAQFDNLEGKEKNKAIIENLAFALNCSFDEINKQKIKQLDKNIKDEVKKMLDEKKKIFDVGKDKLNEKETKFEQAKKEAIPFYLNQLGDGKYTNGENFIKQFDNLEGKGKNKAIIKKLAFALNCSFDEINKQKIKQLDKDIKDKVQELLNKRKEAGDNGKDKLNEKETKFEQAKKEAIPFYLNQLWDESYKDWGNFIAQFDNLEGKEKNKAVIENLAFALNCSFDEINKQKIKQLDEDIKDEVKKMLDEKKKIFDVGKDKLNEKETKFEQAKKEAIPFYLNQLWDESYKDWDNFIAQFDNLEGKEKNKAVIENLAFALNCSFDEINKQKIEQLDEGIKDKVQELLNKRKEAKSKEFEQHKKNSIPYYIVYLADENYTNWDEFIKQFDDHKGKEKNKEIIQMLALAFGCDFNEINEQKIKQLDKDIKDEVKKLLDEKKKIFDVGKDKLKQFDQNKKEKIPFYLNQLGDESYIGWDNFIAQFDNLKGKEKNKAIIEKLASALNCSFDEINQQKIEQLDKNIKDKAQELLYENGEVGYSGKKKKIKQLEKAKEELIVHNLVGLGNENYTDWKKISKKEKDAGFSKNGSKSNVNNNGKNFISMFDDSNWKEKNKEIIKNLSFLLNCSSEEINSKKIADLNLGYEKNGYDPSLKIQLANELRELYIKEYASENEFALKEKQLEQNKKKIISFYIAKLGGSIYASGVEVGKSDMINHDNWMEFIIKFDDSEGKEKNRTIIEKLAFALGCSFDEVNKGKIEKLSDEIKNNVKKILDEIEGKLQNEFKLYKDELIPFYLYLLGEENYTNWGEFIKQFDNLEGKEKNKAIIENLAFALNCSFDEINKQKIEQLDEDIKDKVQELLNKRKEAGDNGKDKLNEKETKFEQAKKEAISFYLSQLWDGKYTNGENFIKQFDDLEGKGKNKAIIEKLAFALNCSFYKINKQKIEQLDEDIKDEVKKLLDEKKKNGNVGKGKRNEEFAQYKRGNLPFYIELLGDENYAGWDNFITQFDNLEGKEKNKAIIENLASALNCSFDEVNKQKIEQLDNSVKYETQKLLAEKKIIGNWRKQTLGLKEEQFENDKKELTISCLDQLGGENYTSWDNFIEQFDDSKGKEENKTIIEELAGIWGYDFDEITKQVINQIDQNMKNETRKILDNKKNMREELLRQKARQFEQSKEELIVFYLNQLSGKIYVCGDEFINQFDDLEGKLKEENLVIITKLASFLNCSNEEINGKKIDGLNKKIKNKAKILLNAKYEILNKFEEELNKIEEEKNLIKQFEYDRDQLIVICFKQLGRKNQIKGKDFLEQFDDSNWKEKNKTIIENLAFALNCSFDEINKQKIDNLIKTHKSLNLDKLSLDNNEKILSEEEKEKFEQSKKELIAIYLVQLWDENYSLGSTFITKFDDQEGKGKNELIITKLASVLNCSNEEINSKKIDDLDEEIKNEFESLIKTNDLNNLLRMNSIKNENLKQNFNKMNDLLKRINVMYKLCYISLGIYTSLADEKIEQKTTITEILEKFNKLHETNKTKVDQTLIKQEKMMRLLYNLMQKLNTQNVGTLIEKINNGLELLKFIIYDNESKKFDELINIFEDYEESGSENVEKDMFNELAINNDGYFDPS